MNFLRTNDAAGQRTFDLLALALILVFLSLSFAPYLLSSPAPLIFPVSELGSDLPREIWPLAYFIRHELQNTGELALWRPYLLSGAPLLGHPVAPIFYPLHWMVLFLPIALALNLGALLHLWWAGSGVYCFLRKEGRIQWEPALFGGLAFALAPLWIARLSGGHWPMLAAIAWMPWVWFAARRMFSSHSLQHAPLLAIGLASQAMNHGVILILTVLWVGTESMVRLILSRNRSWRSPLQGWIIASVLAAGLAAVQLLPALELLPYSNRARLTPAEAGFASLPLPMALSLLFPPRLKFPEWYLFPGIVMLFFAVYGYFHSPASARRRWSLALMISLILAFGLSLRPVIAMVQRVPLLSLIRIPSRWWMFGLFSMTVLASLGVQAWLNQRWVETRALARLLVPLAGVYLLAAVSVSILKIPFPFETGYPALFALIMLIVLFALPRRARFPVLLIVLLLEMEQVRRSLIRPEWEGVFYQQAARLGELVGQDRESTRIFAPYGGYSMSALAYSGLQAVDGYDSFHLAAYEDLVNQSIGCSYRGYVVGVPATRASAEATTLCSKPVLDTEILSLLNVEYIVLPDEMPLPEFQVIGGWEGRVVYRYEGALPGRAFSVAGWQVADEANCVQQLSAVDLSATAIVEEPLPSALNPGRFVVEPRSRRANEEVFRVYAKGPGLLVRSEAWSPGWTAAVDGEPQRVLRVNCAMQGIWLNPGRHLVRFRYAPRSYPIGIRISLGSVLFTFVLLAVTARISRGRSKGANGKGSRNAVGRQKD